MKIRPDHLDKYNIKQTRLPFMNLITKGSPCVLFINITLDRAYVKVGKIT